MYKINLERAKWANKKSSAFLKFYHKEHLKDKDFYEDLEDTEIMQVGKIIGENEDDREHVYFRVEEKSFANKKLMELRKL